jgi:hypothetical protein
MHIPIVAGRQARLVAVCSVGQKTLEWFERMAVKRSE